MVGLLLVVLPLYAADVSDAEYIADIVAQNSGSSADSVRAVADINTQAFIDGGFVTSDLLNTALQTPGGTDIAYMPGVGDNPWALFIPSIGAYEQLGYVFYTGGPAMQTGFHYIPADGGMTTADSASLELGNNFEIELSGYIDTSGGDEQNLIYKEGAIQVYVSDEGEITATIIESGSTTYVNLVPNAAGDYCNIDYQAGCSACPGHYACVDDPPASPDNNTTRVTTSSNAQLKDAFNVEDGSIPAGSAIISVTVYFRYMDSTAGSLGYIQPFLRLDGNETAGTEVACSQNWTTSSEVFARPGGGDWSLDDIEDLQVAIGLREAGDTYTAECTQVYIRVDYAPTLEVVATGISSGEHIIRVTADGTDFTIYVDSVEEDSIALSGVSIPDTANGWSFLANGSVPYMEYLKITVSGVLKQHIVYERDTTFTDLSGNGNDATPTFLTSSSDPDVTVSLSNLWPIEEAELTGYSAEDTPGMLTEPPDMPPEMYTEGETSHLPGASVINAMLDAGGIPRDLFWIPLCYGIAAGVAVLLYHFVKSLLIISIVGGVIILFFALTGVIPLWTFLIYGVLAGGVLVAEKQLSW